MAINKTKIKRAESIVREILKFNIDRVKFCIFEIWWIAKVILPSYKGQSALNRKEAEQSCGPVSWISFILKKLKLVTATSPKMIIIGIILKHPSHRMVSHHQNIQKRQSVMMYRVLGWCFPVVSSHWDHWNHRNTQW